MELIKKEKIKKEKIISEQRKRNYDRLISHLPDLPFKQRHARTLMTVSLLLSDTVSLLVAYGLAVWIRNLILRQNTIFVTWNLIPVILLFLLVYVWKGLYPSVGLSPVTEIKVLMNSTNFVFLFLVALTFLDQSSLNYSRFVLTAAWLLSLVLVQVNRWITRHIGRILDFWGEPVAIVGCGPEGDHIEQYLNERIRLGMRPVLMIDGCAEYENTPLVVINQSEIRTLILVTNEMSDEMQKRLISDQRLGYFRRRGEKSIPRLIMISTLGWVGSLGVEPVDMDGLLGFEVRQNLLNKWPILFKRILDLLLTLFFGIISSPFLLMIMAVIYLDSPGGIFYTQERVGREGKIFKMWKFRTMKANAEKELQSLLSSNPELRSEWEEHQKLKDDPRITRVGRFVRKFSLDEIPQLINVIKGEMSLVGPRPVFQNQLESFGSWIKIYQRVSPGMTGMWQVRGRNDNSFIGKERQRLDEYYIRNWSVWLDIYIIIMTVREVLSRRGAY